MSNKIASLTQAELWGALQNQLESGTLGEPVAGEVPDLAADPDYLFEVLRTRLAEHLYRAMKAAGLNENKLARKLGVSRQAVNEVFQMKTNMTLKSLARFCAALNVEPIVGVQQRKQDVIDPVPIMDAVSSRPISIPLPAAASGGQVDWGLSGLPAGSTGLLDIVNCEKSRAAKGSRNGIRVAPPKAPVGRTMAA